MWQIKIRILIWIRLAMLKLVPARVANLGEIDTSFDCGFFLAKYPVPAGLLQHHRYLTHPGGPPTSVITPSRVHQLLLLWSKSVEN